MCRSVSWLAIGFLASTAVACGGGTEVIAPPPPPPAAFLLTFTPDADDAATAAALGWQAGLPGLAVSLAPTDSSRPAQLFTTSAAGTVAIAGLPAGDYIVEASRWLTGGDRAKLAGTDDAIGFITRTPVRIGTSGSLILSVPASRRRSLVISEWAFNGTSTTDGSAYFFGGYLELFNNSDSTIYLDGLVVGRGVSWDYDHSPLSCSLFRPFSEDPAGVWSLEMQAFPGTGRDHPLAPGHTAVVATDAIDHRPLIPSGLDLRAADFEFVGPADADNPAVPNMVDVGFDALAALQGHGLYFPPLGQVAYVARALDYPSLTLARMPGTSDERSPRVPRERILDVAVIRTNYDAGVPECPRTVDAVFDHGAGFRGRGPAGRSEETWAVARRRIPDGIFSQPVLQDSRSSSTDLIRQPRSPGTQQD